MTMTEDRHKEITLVEGRVVVRPPPRFNLILDHNNDPKTQARATGPNRDDLLELCLQMERLDYRFVRLERIPDEA